MSTYITFFSGFNFRHVDKVANFRLDRVKPFTVVIFIKFIGYKLKFISINLQDIHCKNVHHNKTTTTRFHLISEFYQHHVLVGCRVAYHPYVRDVLAM